VIYTTPPQLSQPISFSSDAPQPTRTIDEL
jgi:hypothetical protein